MDGFTPEGQAASERLGAYYNDGVQTAANPGGYDGDGHLANFIPTLRDVSLVAREIVRIAYSTLAEMERLAAEQHIAALLIEGGPVSSVDGKTGVIVTPQLPRVLAPANQSPAPGSTATLTGGALTLAVVGFNSLYGGTQKSRRAQISTSPDFTSIAWDSGNVAGAQLFVTLANAQSVLTGGTTYHWRFSQTDNEQSFTSEWSAPTSFVFPRAPSAPAMTTPANGATDQGAQNNPIAFAASDYGHPNNVARASRVFEISTTAGFAAIVTRVEAASGSSVASLAAPKDVLQPDTLYYVRCRDTDANGGTNTSAATTFRTVLAFRPAIGAPYKGGYFVGQINDDGVIYDLIVAPKAGGEATNAWVGSGTSNGTNALSRTNGPRNTDLNQNIAGGGARGFCSSLTLAGYDDWYLPAVDELEIAYRNLKPTNDRNELSNQGNNASVPPGAIYTETNPGLTTVVAFQNTGAETFNTTNWYWTSTEASSSRAYGLFFGGGQQGNHAKTQNFTVRAFRRERA